MAATSLRLLLIVIALLVFATAASADSTLRTHNQTINYMLTMVRNGITSVSQQIDACTKEQRSTRTPRIDYRKLKELGVTRQDAMNIVTYLSIKNSNRCIGTVRLQLILAFRELNELLDYYGRTLESIEGVDADQLEAMNAGLTFPGPGYAESAAIFYHLPTEAREYFNQMIGQKLFDPVKAIDKNHLAPKQLGGVTH